MSQAKRFQVCGFQGKMMMMIFCEMKQNTSRYGWSSAASPQSARGSIFHSAAASRQKSQHLTELHYPNTPAEVSRDQKEALSELRQKVVQKTWTKLWSKCLLLILSADQAERCPCESRPDFSRWDQRGGFEKLPGVLSLWAAADRKRRVTSHPPRTHLQPGRRRHRPSQSEVHRIPVQRDRTGREETFRSSVHHTTSSVSSRDATLSQQTQLTWQKLPAGYSFCLQPVRRAPPEAPAQKTPGRPQTQLW